MTSTDDQTTSSHFKNRDVLKEWTRQMCEIVCHPMKTLEGVWNVQLATAMLPTSASHLSFTPKEASSCTSCYTQCYNWASHCGCLCHHRVPLRCPQNYIQFFIVNSASFFSTRRKSIFIINSFAILLLGEPPSYTSFLLQPWRNLECISAKHPNNSSLSRKSRLSIFAWPHRNPSDTYCHYVSHSLAICFKAHHWNRWLW